MKNDTFAANSASANERHLSNRSGIQFGIIIGCILVILAASGGKNLPGSQGGADAHMGDSGKLVAATSGQGGVAHAFSDRLSSTTDHIALLMSKSALSDVSDPSLERMQLGRCGGDYVCYDFQTTMILAAGPQASAGVVQSNRVSLDRECAAKDLEIMTLIEHYGDTGEMGHDELASAAMIMIGARSICADGQVAQALEQYDRLLANTSLASAK